MVPFFFLIGKELIILGQVLAGTAAIVPGYFFGYHVTSFLAHEDFDKYKINIEEMYKMLFDLLEKSVSPGFADKRVYIYYLYFLVLTQQTLILKIKNELNTRFISYYKNTLDNWEKDVKDIEDALDQCYNRYLCYESFIKKIFNIPYDERNIFIIQNKFLTLEKLSTDQLMQLQLFVINPLFNGFYDFTSFNIPVIRCYNVYTGKQQICEPFPNVTKCYDENLYKVICQTFTLDNFPIPETIKTEEFPNHDFGVADVITPWVLHNTILTTKKLTQDMLESWHGGIDSAISATVGIDQSYTVKVGEKVNELSETAMDWYDDLEKGFKNLNRSFNEGLQTTKKAFTNTLMYAGLAAGAFMLFNLISDR